MAAVLNSIGILSSSINNGNISFSSIGTELKSMAFRLSIASDHLANANTYLTTASSLNS